MQRELFFNSRANGLEVLQNVGISEANYAEAVHGQRLGLPLIVALSGIIEMRIPVQLDHEAVSSAVEVRDVHPQRLLARDFSW
jgi:hypothetical protein